MIELYKLNPHKMTTPQEKVQCVSWFIETKSDVQTQRNNRSKYGRDPPSRPSIRLWHKKFIKTGTVFDTRRSGRPRTSEENCKASLSTFSYKVHPYCCQTIGTTTFNSAQGLFHTYFCSFAGSEHLVLSHEPGYTLRFFLSSSHFMGVQFV